MNQNIYVISGLGADHSVFSKLYIPGYTLVHVNWVGTVKGESMGGYAKRLLPQIKEENPIILGLSLGGMLALEISKLIQTKKVISLASITNYKELPFLLKMSGWLRLQHVLPLYFFAKGNWLTQQIFGVKSAEDKSILNEVFVNLDKDFLYWALNAVLSWDNMKLPNNLYRIHGTSDLVLPQRKRTNYDSIIPKGTHLMLLDQSDEVSEAILNQLNT